jgi:hypothetical protein
VSNHDLIAVDPELSALADNGGPTQTMALGAGSPALTAGGACVDPTQPAPFPALTIDQRGLPRPATCDIGAFQHQGPLNTSAPTISGTPAVGQTLTCHSGTWTGAGLTFTYRWQRAGTPIASATAATYVIQAADAGRQLTCVVTASAASGSASATSTPVTVAGPQPPGGPGKPGGSGHPSGPPPGPTAGRVTIPHQTIRILGGGRARVKLKCTGAGFCSGVLRITVTRLPSGAYAAAARGVAHQLARASKHHNPKPSKHHAKKQHTPRHHHKREVIVIAHLTFNIAAGKTSTLRVNVIPLGRGLVNAKGQIAATVRVVATGAKKPITRVIRLT